MSQNHKSDRVPLPLTRPSWLPISLRIKPTFSLWPAEPDVIWPQPVPLACLLLRLLGCSHTSLLPVPPAPKPFPAPGPQESPLLFGMLILHIYMILSCPPSSLSLNVSPSGGLSPPWSRNTSTQRSSQSSPSFEVIILVCLCQHKLRFIPRACHCPWPIAGGVASSWGQRNVPVPMTKLEKCLCLLPQQHARIYDQELLSAQARMVAAVMGDTQAATGGTGRGTSKLPPKEG